MQRAACSRHLAVGHGQREFAPMADTVRRRLVLCRLPVDLEKPCNLAHQRIQPMNCNVSPPREKPDGASPRRLLRRLRAVAHVFHFLQGAAVFNRHHLHEFRPEAFPVVQDFLGALRTGVVQVVRDELVAAAPRRDGSCRRKHRRGPCGQGRRHGGAASRAGRPLPAPARARPSPCCSAGQNRPSSSST